MYSVVHDELTGRFVLVVRTADGVQIPPDPRNGDYAEFLAWNAVQPVPLDTSDRPPLAPELRARRVIEQAVAAVYATAATDPVIGGLVAIIEVQATLLNDTRQHVGLPRVLEADLVPLAVRALTARLGAASA